MVPTILPVRRSKALGRATFVLWTATNMQEGFHNQLLDQGPMQMLRGGVRASSCGANERVADRPEVKRTLGEALRVVKFMAKCAPLITCQK
jgi:hypothetical protein